MLRRATRGAVAWAVGLPGDRVFSKSCFGRWRLPPGNGTHTEQVVFNRRTSSGATHDGFHSVTDATDLSQADKQRPAKKTKSDATASTGGSSTSTQFGELMKQELRLKREAAERAFEA
ncbi:hypothetical protein Tco_0819474 [Tanacetum coccineum]|uniref:ATPase inhibitor n=1 Tax=Tanacetum coccineum TaxID=301880 RepID=A0ABQ5A6P3_9ASTR